MEKSIRGIIGLIFTLSLAYIVEKSIENIKKEGLGQFLYSIWEEVGIPLIILVSISLIIKFLIP